MTLSVIVRLFSVELHTFYASVLIALKKCIDGGRAGTTPTWHINLRKDWWDKMTTYFLHACSCGSLNVVKEFVDTIGYKPNICRYVITNCHVFAQTEICMSMYSYRKTIISGNCKAVYLVLCEQLK